MLLRRVASPMVCSKRTMKEWFGSGSETIKIETPERYIPRVSIYRNYVICYSESEHDYGLNCIKIKSRDYLVE